MKIFLTSILLIIILSSCSFDNKTGIWKNNNEADIKKQDSAKQNPKIDAL